MLGNSCTPFEIRQFHDDKTSGVRDTSPSLMNSGLGGDRVLQILHLQVLPDQVVKWR